MDVHGNFSCTDNSECEDGYLDLKPDLKERRRKLHTEAEQRRRDAIKQGFDSLLDLVHPLANDSFEGSVKLSKATILNKSIAIIEKNSKQQQNLEVEIKNLQKDVLALEILRRKKLIKVLPKTTRKILT